MRELEATQCTRRIAPAHACHTMTDSSMCYIGSDRETSEREPELELQCSPAYIMHASDTPASRQIMITGRRTAMRTIRS